MLSSSFEFGFGLADNLVVEIHAAVRSSLTLTAPEDTRYLQAL